MEPSGQNWNEQWPRYQRSDCRVRDEYRSHQTGQQGHYPSPDVRDSDRRWYAPDPRYMYYMSGPPPAEYSTAYNSQAYTPDRARSHSRFVQWCVLKVCLSCSYFLIISHFYRRLLWYTFIYHDTLLHNFTVQLCPVNQCKRTRTEQLLHYCEMSVYLTGMVCLGRDMITLPRATGTTGMTTTITIMATTEGIMDTQVFT